MTAQNRLSVLFSDIAPADQAALQQRLPTHWHAHFVQNERLVVSDVGDEDTEVLCVFVPEPMCMLSTVPVSSQARKNGSQWPEWIDGRPSQAGHSLKATACTPRAALR